MWITLGKSAIVFSRSSIDAGERLHKQYRGETFANLSVDERSLHHTHVDILRRMQRGAPQAGCSMDDIIRYGGHACSLRVGECFEYCAVVCCYLDKIREGQEALPLSLAVIPSPYFHYFVVIGDEPIQGGFYPNNFTEWNAGTVVVDPWMGICCSARDYPREWFTMLTLQAHMELEMQVHHRHGPSTWEAANNAYFLNMITEQRKLQYTL